MPMVPATTKLRPPQPLAKQAQAQPARRFTDKPDLDPGAVWSLPPQHAALTENRTLFPSTVVDVDENFEDRLLVSGKNNRKLGETVAKGKFKGYALYALSLEERATCSPNCSARAYCYGNGMQMARRHRIGDLEFFAALLEDEIREILQTSDGLLVRLHVLGDFPTVEYVEVWADLLKRHPGLACYGYTHWLDGEIADAIQEVKADYPDRFRIRWSSDKPRPDGAIVIDRIPDGPKFNGALVCPAQTDATACCASCGLCWEGGVRRETIAFIKHGKKSIALAASSEAAPIRENTRRVLPITLPSGVKPAAIEGTAPTLRLVDPKSLVIEATYQRDLSGPSIKLIRKIVAGWDWTKFKPPVCAENGDELFVIDGQHTAIAAATHPDIRMIPVMIAKAGDVQKRAASFVSHNRDRVAMTPAQIFYGDLAACDKTSRAIMECVVASGASVPRTPVAKGYWKVGQIAAVGELQASYKSIYRDGLIRVLRICVAAGLAPITNTMLRAMRHLFSDPAHARLLKLPDAQFVQAIKSLGDIDKASEARAAATEQSRFRACAELIAEALS